MEDILECGRNYNINGAGKTDNKGLVECELEPLFKAAPTIITWELWKNRNTSKNGGSISTNIVIHEVNKTLHYLARLGYSWLHNIPLTWHDMIQFFERYRPILITTKVTWEMSCQSWYKYNKYGASKGNPG